MDSRRYNNENQPPCGIKSNSQQNLHPLSSTFYQSVYTNSSLPNLNQQPPNHRIPMGSVLPQLRHPLTQVSQGSTSYATNSDKVSGCYPTNSTCSTFYAGNPVSTCQINPVQGQGDTPRSSVSPDDTSSNESPSFPVGSVGCPGKRGAKQGEKQRLSNKQQVERQRRERINSSMNELKSLLLQDNSATGGLASAKLERADVLEMAVTRIKELKNDKSEGDAGSSGVKIGGQNANAERDLTNLVTRYAAGFAQCTQEVMTFIEMCDELKLNPAWKTKLANHLQSCNRTLELATQNNKDAGPGPGLCPNTFAVPNASVKSNDVTRSPVPSFNMYNQASPMIPPGVVGTPRSRTPNINYISPATPISTKHTVNSTSTSRNGVSRLNFTRQTHFLKTEQVAGSPGFAGCNSSFKDNMPTVLGTVATPPTPKQAPLTTSMAHFNRGIRQPNLPMFTPSPPRKVLRISGNSPVVPRTFKRSPAFEAEDSNDEVVGFEPMYPLPENVSGQVDFLVQNSASGLYNDNSNCWRPW